MMHKYTEEKPFTLVRRIKGVAKESWETSQLVARQMANHRLGLDGHRSR